MSIYSDQVQALTNTLVADVNTLAGIVANNAADFTNISNATTVVLTDTNNLNTAIQSTPIPADNTMILSLTTTLLSNINDLQAAITANDSTGVTNTTAVVVLTTSNLNTCVTRMSENQTSPLSLPQVQYPWFQVPTVGTPVP